MATAVALVIMISAVASAIVIQIESSRPIGEGDLFLREASTAAAQAGARESSDMETVVRHIRNELEIEAVSVVGPDGVVHTSTSETLVNQMVSNPIVAFAHSSGVFAAAAMPVSETIFVDGVAEWNSGDTLYAVVHPMASSQSLLFHYDISELLTRRSQNDGIRPLTLAFLGLAMLGAAAASIAAVGRSRSKTRFLVLERESELLRQHAAELADRNVELDAARAAAEQALELAEEKNRIRGEFVMMINHELRTPLTSMVTGTQILSEGDLDPESRAGVIDAMLRDGERLERLISQILGVARVENRGLDSTTVQVQARAMWESVVTLLPLRATLVDDLGSADIVVRTDPETLGHLVSSLVDNAFQHGAHNVTVTMRGAQTIDAQLRVGSDVVSGVAITVSDDGPGISEEFLPRAFEKFEKDSFSSGTGLGLYVVKLMADAIGCSVGLASSPSGSVFEIVLPTVLMVAPAGART